MAPGLPARAREARPRGVRRPARVQQPQTALTAPLLALCAYAALIPLQPIVTMPDGSTLRFAGSEVVAPLVFLAAVARPRRRVPAGPAALALAIPVLALFSTLVAVGEHSLSLYAIGKTAGLFYLVGLCLAAVRSTEPGAERVLLDALAWGALWSGALGLAGFAASVAGMPNSLVHGERLCSTMTGDPNIFCSLLAVGLVITAMDRRLSARARIVRSLLLVAAILATGSRSGAGAALVGVVTCVFVRTRDVWLTAARVAYVVVGIALIASVVLLTGPGANAAHALWDHLWRTFTVETRFDLYREAFRQFSRHTVLGLGVGGFNDLTTWYDAGHGEHFAVHNTYLWALVDMGLGGGLLVAGLIAAGVWRCARAARRWAALESAAVVAGGLAAMATFNLFIDGFYQRHFWVLMACALGMPAVTSVRRPAVLARHGGRARSFAHAGAR